MNATISKSRIEAVHDLLCASGWRTDNEGGYFAPERIQSEIAQQYGKGALHLWDAINAQVRFDSFVVSEHGSA